MCKAISEGGRRCQGHALEAFTAAREVLERRDKSAGRSRIGRGQRAEMVEQYHRAAADLATTAAGRDHLVRSFDDTVGATKAEMGRLLEQMQRGLALAEHHDKMKAIGEQSPRERQAAAAMVQSRGARIAGALRRAAVVGYHLPASAAMAYGALHLPGPWKYVATGLVMTNVVSGLWLNRRKIAPAEQRTGAEQAVHAQIAKRVADGDPELRRRAAKEIQDRLDKTYPEWSEAGVVTKTTLSVAVRQAEYEDTLRPAENRPLVMA